MALPVNDVVQVGANDRGYQPALAWRMVVLLALFTLINFLDKIVLGLVAVPMMAELQLTPSQFGILAGSFFWLFAMGGVLGGWLADRFATKWIIATMAASWALLQFPLVVSSSLIVIGVCRVLLGMAEGPSWPVVLHSLYKWFPNSKRTLPAGLIGQTAGLGLILAGLAIPRITESFGWRANFVVLGCVGVAWLCLWLFLGREGTLTEEANRDGEPQTDWRAIARNKTYLACIFAHFAAFWSLALTLTWVPVYLETGLGFDAVTAGRMFAIFIAVNVVMGLLMPTLSQWLSSRGVPSRVSRVMLTCATLAIGGLCYILLLWSGLPALAKVGLLGIGAGLAQTIYFTGPAIIGESTPVSQRGSLLAIDNSLASLAGIVAPVVTGFLVQYASGGHEQGYAIGFAVAGAILMVACLTSAIFMHPGTSRPAAQPASR